jgi:hypothetical protein
MVKVRTLTAVLAAAILGLTLGAGAGLAQDKEAAPKKVEPRKMILSGISSGVLRVPEIAVWSCAGGGQGGCLLVGKIKHGTEVTRYESEKARGLKWYRIEGAGMQGWVRDTFLKPTGT